ncbi:MAG TPA: hypothetical protein VHL59_17085 [Thermoanaerobaculia bacterium]|nr:hypothetical protein [Thermoanaerobaculia bacterium]
MILILTMLLAAQPPTVGEILQRFEAALGDPAVARSHESRIVRSTYEEASGGEAEVFEYYLAPDKYLHLMVLDEGLSMRLGTDGKSVWNDTPRGPEIIPAEKVSPLVRDAVFNRNLELRRIYPQMRVVGAASVAGRAAWQIEATGADGQKEQMFFDAASGLLVRRTYAFVLPSGYRVSRDLIYEEYADFDGVRMPSRIRQFSPGAALFTVHRVDHNADIFELIFAPPSCGEKK